MIAQRLFSFALLACLLVGCGDSSDPYFNQDPELRIELRSLVVPRDHDLLSDPSRRWGLPYDMYNVTLREGGNVAEIGVGFLGGCGTHRFSLYAYDTYEGRATPDTPLDIKLFLYHSQVDEDCREFQDQILRRVDLSFLSPGRYNITIENPNDRSSFSTANYEIK